MDKKEQIIQAALCMTRQCWEQGILGQAIMESGKEELWELTARDMVVRQSEDGRLCNVENTPAVTDSSFCIPAVYLLGQKKEKYKKAAEKNLQFLLHKAERSKDGILYHMINTKEIWADSAAFLPYSLALAGFYEEDCTMKKAVYIFTYGTMEKNDFCVPFPGVWETDGF